MTCDGNMPAAPVFMSSDSSDLSQMMQTSADGVFAGGDVVVFPFLPRNNKKVNIPHWQMAHVHGECVARLQAEPPEPTAVL